MVYVNIVATFSGWRATLPGREGKLIFSKNSVQFYGLAHYSRISPNCLRFSESWVLKRILDRLRQRAACSCGNR
jgi:hypothetical protein